MARKMDNKPFNSMFGPNIKKTINNLLRFWFIVKDKIENKSTQEIFTNIFNMNTWGSIESRSGLGSTLSYTVNIRRELVRIIDYYHISVILDAPCGDYNWMKEISLNVDKYLGVDIVPDLIICNRKKYGSEQISFEVIDIIKDPIPRVDLILCRECLQHLSIKDSQSILSNFIASGSTYLLATTFPSTTFNHDIGRGNFFAYNLCIPPFNMAEPIEIFKDNDYKTKPCMALWKIN